MYYGNNRYAVYGKYLGVTCKYNYCMVYGYDYYILHRTNLMFSHVFILM